MDREQIIRMAREAGLDPDLWNYTDAFERFAALVATAEREACAKVCEEVESRAEELWDKFAYPEDQGMASGARQCTTAIRARGQA
jgi:DNA-binding protein YbaB